MSVYSDYKPLMDKIGIEMIERGVKVMQGFDDGCKNAKTIKILCADKPIVRGYDGAILHEGDK